MKVFYGVKELTELSGVSVRTLHYYDKIGLLPPSNRTEAGYRYYGEEELLRLQQILFYKELDFSLKEILELLDEPDFDLINALENHKAALKARQQRLSALLVTIDNTIKHVKQENIMSKPEILYEGLPKEVGTTYRQQAMDKYGQKTIEQSEKGLVNLGKEGFKQLNESFKQINIDLFELQTEAPESEPIQNLIAHHYAAIRQFWGTSHSSDKQAEAYTGLGQLYVHDERYTTVNGEPQPKFALFLQKAMKYFADNQLK